MTDDYPNTLNESMEGDQQISLPATPVSANGSEEPFSLLALFALVGGLAGVALAGLTSVFVAIQPRFTIEEKSLIISILLTAGLMGLPLAWWAWQRVRGKPSPAWEPRWVWVGLGVSLTVLALGLGQAAITVQFAPAFVLSILQPLIFACGVVVLVTMASGTQTGLSRLRAWGHFISGAWLSVFLALVAESLLAIVAAVVVMAVLAVVAPAQARQILDFFQQAQDHLDEQAVLTFIQQPWVIVLAYVGASLLIPMIEELLKPIGVVILVGRKPTPQAAFLGGLLGGLGFGMLESLSNLINIQDPWLVLVIARLGTLVMHGFAAGLVGWGWGELSRGRPGRLALAYLGAIAIHGLWNGAVVTFVYGGLAITNNPNNSSLAVILGLVSVVCALLVVGLVVTCTGGLVWLGYRLRASPPSV